MKKIIALLCLISMLMLAGCSNNSDDLYTEIDQLKNQIATLNEENTNLKNELNELESIINNQDNSHNDNTNNTKYPLYNEWVNAETSTSERSMYEDIIHGFIVMDDEMSRGWRDDSTLMFLRLIKGDALSQDATSSQMQSVYDSLEVDIQYTTYCIRDFFTVTEYGDSTNSGIFNFLRAIDQLEDEKFNGKNLVDIDANGFYSFDFDNQEVAAALGISVELVSIILHAAVDAGFGIDFN